MPGHVEQGSSRRRPAGEGASVRLAVYHASADVDRHVAELKRGRRFRILCIPQRAVPAALPRAVDLVLWELTRGRRPNWRRISALAPGVRAVSYSVDAGEELADLSRATGFASHLQAPLRAVDVEHRLALTSPLDLATRLRQFQPTLRAHLGRADTLGEVIRATSTSFDPARVGETLAARLAAWLPVPAWAVLATDLTGTPQLLAHRGMGSGVEEVVKAVGAWVVRRGEEYVSGNLRDQRWLSGAPAAAALAFPLVCRDKTMGAVVGLDDRVSTRPPRLASSTLAALRRLLEPAAVALDTALHIQRVEALSVTDDLTQLYNLRYLLQVLRRETRRASRSGRPLSLLFIDLDGFKRINDSHGHLCGSRALVEAAQVIRSSGRETDVAARYGGDEFALVLPETGGEGALAVAERVCERIAAHAFLAAEGLSTHLTASVGVATLPEVAVSAEGLVQAADQAMYWVKDRGKNGIHVAGSPDWGLQVPSSGGRGTRQ